MQSGGDGEGGGFQFLETLLTLLMLLETFYDLMETDRKKYQVSLVRKNKMQSNTSYRAHHKACPNLLTKLKSNIMSL